MIQRIVLAALVWVLAICPTPARSPDHSPGAERDCPGEILRADRFPGAPEGSVATRLLYRSSAPDGTPIAVSGLVVVPLTAASPGGRPVLAWLHPTTGVAGKCAPTLGPSPFAQIQGLAAFLAAGYVVVAPDYPGLGGPGPHPYLVGASEARAALDSVRAVQHLPQAQAAARFAVWGHSQGGQAALFTAALASSYAPELQLVGVAAAAPVSDIATLIERPGHDPLWGPLTAYLVWSWSRVFDLDPNAIVPAAAREAIDRTAEDCLESASELQHLLKDAAPLSGQPITPAGRWRALMADNDPRPWSNGPPVFLAQGNEDPVIPQHLTRQFANRLCRQHTPVRYLLMPGVDHYSAARLSAKPVAAWLAERFAGFPPPDDCAEMLRRPQAARP